VFLVAAGALAGVLAWGFGGLPRFGTFDGAYGQILNHVAVPQRHITDVVAAVNFDYRGFDTLGEEFISAGSGASSRRAPSPSSTSASASRSRPAWCSCSPTSSTRPSSSGPS